jgi:hypothetical protein
MTKQDALMIIFHAGRDRRPTYRGLMELLRALRQLGVPQRECPMLLWSMQYSDTDGNIYERFLKEPQK